MWRIPAKWRDRFRPLCERLFSGKEGPEHEIVSDMFEVPYVLKTKNVEAPSINDFNPLSLTPATWQQ